MSAEAEAPNVIIRKTIGPISSPRSVDPGRQTRIALAEHNQLTMRSSLAWCDHKSPKALMTGRSCSLFTMYKIARRANAQHSQNSLMDIPGDNGGARRDRTDDLMLAKHALSQLSYGPSFVEPRSPTPCTSSSRRRSLRKPKRCRR